MEQLSGVALVVSVQTGCGWGSSGPSSTRVFIHSESWVLLQNQLLSSLGDTGRRHVRRLCGRLLLRPLILGTSGWGVPFWVGHCTAGRTRWEENPRRVPVVESWAPLTTCCFFAQDLHRAAADHLHQHLLTRNWNRRLLTGERGPRRGPGPSWRRCCPGPRGLPPCGSAL